MPKVSVIIPNYNHAGFLNQRIDSVLLQTYQDFELIILDDCSTDYSRQIINAYTGHPKVSLILFNDTNSGSTFKQWRKGIENAKGELIWIAESDDYADHTFLEKLLEKITLQPGVGVAYCQSWRVDEHNKVLDSCKSWFPARWQSDFVNDGKAEIRDHFLFHGILNASATLFKRDIAMSVSDRFTTFSYFGDQLFWIEMLLKTDIYYLADELNFFRTHEKNVSGAAARRGVGIKEGLSMLYLLQHELENYPSYQQRIHKFVYDWVNILFSKDNALTFRMNREILGYVIKLKSISQILGALLEIFKRKMNRIVGKMD